jgi:hypothetical protein
MMDSQKKKQNVCTAMPSKAPEIGTWLWAFRDSRRRTLETVGGVTSAMIDWLPPDNESSIGTVLYPLRDPIENPRKTAGCISLWKPLIVTFPLHLLVQDRDKSPEVTKFTGS